MEIWIRFAWLSLAVVHLAPSLVLFAPSLVQRLYGVAPTGDVGLLLVHRGALFLVVVVGALVSMFDPSVRRLMTLLVGISVVGFLLTYARAGFPEGPLRTIAVADAFALMPLVVVGWTARS